MGRHRFAAEKAHRAIAAATEKKTGAVQPRRGHQPPFGARAWIGSFVGTGIGSFVRARIGSFVGAGIGDEFDLVTERTQSKASQSARAAGRGRRRESNANMAAVWW